MSLPRKAEKEYLELAAAGDGYAIAGEPRHAAQLAGLFRQHGIACRLGSGTRPGEDLLVLTAADPEQVQSLLDSYKHAKGS